ncbi:MAG: ATP-binding cassette domain-containing protein [Candidatus Riflebacteria bacterium]|nr:ATP-binding cassette domain-containing protein [Candidatus Riflebacteria bacterium]
MTLHIRLQKTLRDFTLDVAWEIGTEIGVIFGYSGAGKSISLQMIAGLRSPDAGMVKAGGRVLYDSNDSTSLSPQERRIGYVFQDSALFPHFTVADNIRYGLREIEKGPAEDALQHLAVTFEIEELLNKYPAQISGGQKQRVAFARALIGKPIALLLDEPFSALDNPIRGKMRLFLRKIQKEFSIPIVLVTHDIFEAYTMADRLIIYSEGRVVQCGTPVEVFGNPATEAVKDLVNVDELCRCAIFKKKPGSA